MQKRKKIISEKGVIWSKIINVDINNEAQKGGILAYKLK